MSQKNKIDHPIQSLDTDVLVIGTGGAGCRAALEACGAGARVTLVTKGRFAKSGTTAFRVADTAGYNAADGGVDPLDSPEEHYRDILEAGLGMAYPRLARVLAEEALETIPYLESVGARLERDPASGRFIEVKGCFASRPRMHILKDHGERIIRALAPRIKALPIDIREEVIITRLLVEDGRCLGAVGVNGQGETVVFRAGAVILACGGAGQLFAYTLTPPDITGDGYALGLRAGADLVNLEFMQVVLGTLEPTRNQFNTFLWCAQPRLLNAAGQPLLEAYLPAGVSPGQAMAAKSRHFPFSSRDDSRFVEIAVHKEMLGPSGAAGVFVDLTGLSDEKVAALPPDCGLPKVWPFVKEFMAQRGFEIGRKPVRIGCFAHAINGGLKIDADGQTTVAGLYAAGEAAGGPHGADRLGGNMLVTCQVFGARAGRHAAQAAASTAPPRPPRDQVDLEAARLEALRQQSGPRRAADLRKSLQESMWRGAMVVRTEEKLKLALGRLEDIEASLRAAPVRGPRDLKDLLELENMVLVGRAICRAALSRRESRGSHYREDWPALDPAWRKRILIRQEDGVLREIEEPAE